MYEEEDTTQCQAFEMILNTLNQLLAISGHNPLVPGMSINMAVVLEKEFAKGGKCPQCSKSFQFTCSTGGGGILIDR